MLSGPITQEAGITETRARERRRENEEVVGEGEEPGERRQLEGGEKKKRVELRCTKISWEVTELETFKSEIET